MGEIERNAGQLRSMLEEQKRAIQSAVSEVGNVKFTLEKVTTTLKTQISDLDTHLSTKMEKINVQVAEELAVVTKSVESIKNECITAVDEIRVEISGGMSSETEQLKTYVIQTANRASAHRETLQKYYDEKLDKIKDVCASYFTKYEGHLVQQ